MVDWMATGGGDQQDSTETGNTLAKFWITGNKYLCPGYCNFIMEKVIGFCTECKIYPEMVLQVFNGTVQSSKLRLVVMNALQAKGPLRDLPEGEMNFCKEHWLEFVSNDHGIEGAGEVIRACMLAGGIHRKQHELAPRHSVSKYMEEWDPIEVKEFAQLNK